jgi:hypothetical protein
MFATAQMLTPAQNRLIVDTILGLVCARKPDWEVEVVNSQMLDYFGKTLEEVRNWES